MRFWPEAEFGPAGVSLAGSTELEVSRKDRSSVLVTGASGFVGGALVRSLAADERYQPTGLIRRNHAMPADAACFCVADDIGPNGDWRGFLKGKQAIVHAAARVHKLSDAATDPLAAYRATNTRGTLALARQAAEVGVSRFIFLSTIKVNGERTEGAAAFRADDDVAPSDPYAISKREAEEGLFEIGAEMGMEIVVIRPPLVYGPGVKGNLRQMMAWLARGLPLPLGSVDNARSLVSLGNLAGLVGACLSHERAAGEVFLAGDGEDLSTPDLLRRTARAMDRPARLWRVPQGVIRSAARLARRETTADRLLDSLRVDIGKTRAVLNWEPHQTVDDGIAAMARHYLDEAR